MLRVILSAALLAFSSFGCIATSGDADSIVERSATERPEWANGDVENEGPSEAYLVFRREEVYRLELGIKQAQAAAIRKTKDLLLSRAKVEVEERAEKLFDGKKTVDATAMAEAVNHVADSKYAPNEAAARNVYWENIRKETSEGPKSYYNIYVLLVAPRTELDAATYRVAKILSESKNPDAKAIGEAVVKDLNTVETIPPAKE